VERERLVAVAVVRRERFKQQRLVIAAVQPAEHATGEQARAVVEQWQAVRALAPRGALELVHLVAGLAAEQLRQR
jgi:hypothetical protein